MVHVAADVAEKRRARGLRLNYPESIALLTSWVYEAARDGRTVVDLMSAGCEVLTRDGLSRFALPACRPTRASTWWPRWRCWARRF